MKSNKTGYVVELADGGPWLKEDGTWTPVYSERGVWLSADDAKLAVNLSLREPFTKSEPHKNRIISLNGAVMTGSHCAKHASAPPANQRRPPGAPTTKLSDCR